MLFWGRILLEKQSFKKLHLKKIYTASTEMKDTDFKKKHKLYFQQDCINKILFRVALLIIILGRVKLKP